MKRASSICLVAGWVLALAGCSDGSSTAITATADRATVDWNTASSIDVLANDSASFGTLTLAGVAAPAHGTAAISDAEIRYTPDSGYFGTDTFTYTVQANDGTTASATVTVTVNARLTLSGTVADGTLAGAAVTATVGTQTTSATAGADGTYSVVIRTSTLTDMLAVTAVGAGSQAKVKLRSLLGDAQTVAALATADGTVGADQYASTNVSNVSTIVAAIVEEANGGAVTLQTQLAALMPTAPSQLLTDGAVAIKLVADEGVALPPGVADTMALVDHPSTSATLSAFLDAQETGTALNQYFDAQTSVLTLGTLPGGAARTSNGAAQTIAYTVASKAERLFELQAAYGTDGTVQVLLADGTHTGTWSQADSTITITFSPSIQVSTTLNGSPAIETITGYQISQLAGTATTGVAIVQPEGSWTPVGKLPLVGLLGATIVAAIDTAAGTPLAASDFATGSSWGGLIVGRGVNDVPAEDILTITGASTGTFVRTGAAATWSVDNGVLKVVSGSVEYDYQRLVAAATGANEEWLASEMQGGQAIDVDVQMVAKATPGLKFSADSSITRRWQNGLAYYSVFDLDAGGTGEMIPNLMSSPTPLTWAVAGDGTLTITESTGATRTWSLLGQPGGGLLVMEHLAQNGADYWRMNLYTDLSAATP